ncbi:MAG: HNH endonuclease [Acidobacteria bacterium]|nr:HNH endonuclease [Acidobacteriota bacterium]
MAEQTPAAVRRLVALRAGDRCEYCLISADDTGFSHEVDHILSRKHGGSNAPDNLAYACMICNRYKGSDIASRHWAGQIVRLFDPRKDLWDDHFVLAGPVIEPLTLIGEVTAVLLRINAAGRVAERQILQSLGRYPTRSAQA